ncbi:MAG: sulfite exporter TauE/SafE family protein [Proteobacteria bacterium]|nr:sulfite exporter TauE/SafE family protein [Pseudomonadota bacterium]
MEAESILFLLTAVALGCYIQTVTGFAMGLIVMGVVASLQLAPIAFIAALISLIGLVNVTMALYKSHHHIHWHTLKIVILGMIPAMVGGVLLLDYLSENFVQTLQLILGVAIIISGMLLMFKPHPQAQLLSSFSTWLTGIASGILAGMFSTGAPPLIYTLYKQPLSIKAIRSTILAIFLISSIARISFISTQGHITIDVITLFLYSLPIVFLFTWLGKKHPPVLSDIAMRRSAFGLLILLGISTTSSFFF